MTRFLITLILLLFAFPRVTLAIDAYFDYKVFHIPEQGPMVETYLNFFAESLKYEPIENGFGEQATIEITIIVSKGEEIVTFSKKSLVSGVVSDSAYTDLLDQQRFALDYGMYQIEVLLQQPGYPESKESFIEKVTIQKPEETVFFSDVQWVAAFRKAEQSNELTKSGYDLLPFVSNHFPAHINQLMFYNEIYGTDQALGIDESFLLVYYIEDHDRGKTIESLLTRSRKNAKSVIPVMNQIDISDLPTGNYNLIFEVRNRENELLAKQTRFFQRTGNTEEFVEADYMADIGERAFTMQFNDIDTLYEHLNSLLPIAGDGEANLILRFSDNKDLVQMQRFFYTFWKQRNQFAPEAAWNEYYERVRYVESRYATPNKKGYQTDMGRVYLAYGRPDVVTDRPAEPNAYPYQIWQYFRAERWTNIRFVFYDRTLLQNDYELLHCDKIPGEIKNPRWDILIHQRDTPLNNIDNTQSRDHFGGRTQDFWDTPR